MPLTTLTPRAYETITTWDVERGTGLEFTCIPTGAPASATWPSANLAIACPIYIDSYGTVVKLWTANGATASGNFDIGLYDESFNKLVSIGATAQSGTSTIQTRARYFLFMPWICQLVEASSARRPDPHQPGSGITRRGGDRR